MIGISRGPAVTRYEIAPESGTKVAAIMNRSDDISLSLASAVRISGVIPGKSAIGIEVPNKNVSTVYLRELVDTETFRKAQSKLNVSLGRSTLKFIRGDVPAVPWRLFTLDRFAHVFNDRILLFFIRNLVALDRSFPCTPDRFPDHDLSIGYRLLLRHLVDDVRRAVWILAKLSFNEDTITRSRLLSSCSDFRSFDADMGLPLDGLIDALA